MIRSFLLIVSLCFAGTVFAAPANNVYFLNASTDKDLTVTYAFCETAPGSLPKCAADRTMIVKSNAPASLPKPSTPQIIIIKSAEMTKNGAVVAKGEYPLADDYSEYSLSSANDAIVFSDFNTDLVIATKGKA